MCFSSNTTHSICPALNPEGKGLYPFIFPEFEAIEKRKPPDIKLRTYAEISSKIFAELCAQDQSQAKLVCKEWKQLIQELIQEKENEFIQAISNNGQLMSSNKVTLFVGDYLQQPSGLLEVQHKLLKMVKLSKISWKQPRGLLEVQHKLPMIRWKQLYRLLEVQNNHPKISWAAANAMMILKKTGFSFVNEKLKKIQIPPGTELSHAIFDGAILWRANLSHADLRYCSLVKARLWKANLSYADLTDCSLVNTILDNANLEGIEFGHRPYLQHDHPVLAAALSPDKKYLASNDEENLYVWNLKTFDKMSAPVSDFPFFSRIFLLFSQDGKFLFRAYGQGDIEIWETTSLKKVRQLKLENMNSFSLFALTKEGLIISEAQMKRRSTNREADQKAICLWKIDLNKENFLHLQLEKSRIIWDNKMEREGLVEDRRKDISFFPEQSVLAVKIYQRKCIEFYSLSTLGMLKDWTIPLEEEIDNISSIQFTPKGALLFTVKGEKGEEVYAWNREYKKKIYLFSEKSKINNLRFVPNSSLIAYWLGTDRLCMRNTAEDYKLKVLEQFPTQESSIPNMTFLLANKRLLRFSKEKIFIRPLKIFFNKKEAPLSKKETPFHTRLRALRFSSDDKAIYLLNSKGRLYKYESSSGRRLPYRTISSKEHALPISKSDPDVCTLSLDAQYALVAQLQQETFHITISQANNGSEYATFKMNALIGCALSKDNRYLVIAHQDHFEIWNIASKKPEGAVSIEPHHSLVGVKIGLILSPSVFPAATLITVEYKQRSKKANEHELRPKKTKIWKIDDWRQSPKAQLVKQFPSITNIHFLDDSQIIFQENCFTISIWNRNTHEEKKIDFNKPLESFALSQDGSELSQNGPLMITAQNIIKPSHSSGYNTKLKLWDVQQEAILAKMLLPFSKPQVCISPHGKFVVCGGNNLFGLKKIHTWEIKKARFHLLWKIPRYLEARGVSQKDVKNLSEKNNLLLSQFQFHQPYWRL